MPKQSVTYEIEDVKSADDNLAEFASRLVDLDPDLGAVLSQHLSAMSHGEAVDLEQLRTDLAAATVPESGVTEQTGNSE